MYELQTQWTTCKFNQRSKTESSDIPASLSCWNSLEQVCLLILIIEVSQVTGFLYLILICKVSCWFILLNSPLFWGGLFVLSHRRKIRKDCSFLSIKIDLSHFFPGSGLLCYSNFVRNTKCKPLSSVFLSKGTIGSSILPLVRKQSWGLRFFNKKKLLMGFTSS